MTGRRSLVDGLKPAESEQDQREKEFVYGPNDPSAADPTAGESVKANNPVDNPPSVSQQAQSVLPQYSGRVPITTRCRPQIASTVRREAATTVSCVGLLRG